MALPQAPGKRDGPTREVARGPVSAVGPTIVRAGAAIGAHLAPPPPPTFVSSPRDHELLDMEGTTMTREEWKALIREALQEPNQVPLAPKWEGGTIILKPHDPALQAKELPLDALFRKVVMIRDRLRVLEQKVNAHPKLTDTDKVEMQQYVTRCYGSLTSFNLLFHDKRDHFVGDKSGGD
jgi:hypothetical protein